MTPHLRIQLLGEFRLLLDDKLFSSVNQRRQQALLTYLLLHRHAPQPRQFMAYNFWPDSSEGQAQTNLRKLYFELRKALPHAEEFLFADSRSLGWRPDAPFTLDVAEVEKALGTLEGEGTLGTPLLSTPLLGAAVQSVVMLYQGDLFPACYEEWLLPVRRSLHERVVNTLTNAISRLEAQRDFQGALAAAEHLLRLDPLHEAAYRQLMHLRMLSGDRAGALRVYHECASMLEQELEVSPAHETQALYQHLLKLDTQSTPVLAPTPEVRHEHVSLVGRKQEWQQLLQAWREMGEKGPHLITIWGEAGMGKTRLVEELLRWARLRPGMVAYARAYAAEGALAYTPLTEWLRSEALRPVLTQIEPLWQTEIARLLPELLTAHPQLPAPTPMSEGWQRQRFHEALARVMLAAPAPRLLVLDDLQWCDAETLNWLRYLLRFDAQAPLLVVGTIRSEAVDEEHPLHELLIHLRREDQLTTLELGPLRPEETALLARELVGAGADQWATDLHNESEGNPLFVVETVRAGAMGPGMMPGLGQGKGAGSTTSLPATVQAVIAARLAQLSPLAQQVAQVAATVGRAFTYEILASVEEIPEGHLVQSLDELWRRRIVREQESGYDFCHDKIREVVYSQISRARRQWLHRRIAQALQAQHGSKLEEVYGLLASHLQRAGDGQAALHFWLLAGEQALATYAPQQALANFQRGLALTSELSAGASAGAASSEGADGYFGVARAYFALDQLDEAALQSKHALELLQPEEMRRGKVLYFLAEVAFATYDVAACERYALAARAVAEACQDHETFCQSLSLLGQVCSARGDLASEVQLITEALQRSRQIGNRWREGRTLADLGWLHAQRAEFEQAIAAADGALAALSAPEMNTENTREMNTVDRAALAFTWNVLGRAHGGCGHYATAFAAFAASEEIAAAIDHKFLLAQVPNMHGWLHFQLGDYARALELDQQGVQLAQAWNKRPAEISARINVALDLLHLTFAGVGNPEEAMDQLQKIQTRIEEESFGFHAWRWRLRILEGQGLCSLALGLPKQAYELALVGEQLARSTTSRKYIASNQLLLGLALAQMDQGEAAIGLIEQATALADAIGYQPLRWQGYSQLALLYRAAGRGHEAEESRTKHQQVIAAMAAEIGDDSERTLFLQRSQVGAFIRATQPS